MWQHEDVIDLNLLGQSLHTHQQFMNEVDVRVGQFKAMDLDLRIIRDAQLLTLTISNPWSWFTCNPFNQSLL